MSLLPHRSLSHRSILSEGAHNCPLFLIGKTIEILIDEVDEEGAIGRSAADAPEIDGKVFLDGATDLQPGDFVEAPVTAASEYNLWAG